MKKIILSLFILPFLFLGSFSGAYVLTWFDALEYIEKTWELCPNKWSCSFDWLVSIVSTNSTPCFNVNYYCSSWRVSRKKYDRNNPFKLSDFSNCWSQYLEQGFWFDNSAGCNPINSYSSIILTYSQKKPVSVLWHFTPVINWLKNIVFDILPYLSYLWLWIITVAVWFISIRWLINRTRLKINNNFRNKRR